MTAWQVTQAALAAGAGLVVAGAVVDRVRPRSPRFVARLLLRMVRFYQRFISPALPPSCRFTPSCSAYAAEAIGTHGARRGLWLTLRRLGRCGPWHPGGHDPVPPAVRSGDTTPATPPASPTGATRC